MEDKDRVEKYEQLMLIDSAINIYRENCIKSMDQDNDVCARNINNILIRNCDAILEKNRIEEDKIDKYFSKKGQSLGKIFAEKYGA